MASINGNEIFFGIVGECAEDTISFTIYEDATFSFQFSNAEYTGLKYDVYYNGSHEKRSFTLGSGTVMLLSAIQFKEQLLPNPPNITSLITVSIAIAPIQGAAIVKITPIAK